MECLSMGDFCISSYILKKLKLKERSYPFDWIFSYPHIILDCLETNFEYFLKDEYLESRSATECFHKKYNLLLFNHHNPKDNDEHKQYFGRCINRFNIMRLNNNKKVVFRTVQYHDPNIELYENKKYYTNLKQHINNFELIVILIVSGKEQTCDMFYSDSDLYIYKITTISSHDGLCFNDIKDQENIELIFKNHSK